MARKSRENLFAVSLLRNRELPPSWPSVLDAQTAARLHVHRYKRRKVIRAIVTEAAIALSRGGQSSRDGGRGRAIAIS